MTRYERVQEAIRSQEHKISHKGVRDLLLVVDLPDHREELGSVHVDAARAALDWFCKHHPDHPICIASASKQNTKKTWEEFGYTHLPREYNQVRFVDLNESSMPNATLVVFLLGAHRHSVRGVRRPSQTWRQQYVSPTRHYTANGHVWHREALNWTQQQPNLVIVDASIARDHDAYFEPIPRRTDQVFAEVDLGEADRVCCELYD